MGWVFRGYELLLFRINQKSSDFDFFVWCQGDDEPEVPRYVKFVDQRTLCVYWFDVVTGESVAHPPKDGIVAELDDPSHLGGIACTPCCSSHGSEARSQMRCIEATGRDPDSPMRALRKFMKRKKILNQTSLQVSNLMW